jgi:hypothetical protein
MFWNMNYAKIIQSFGVRLEALVDFFLVFCCDDWIGVCGYRILCCKYVSSSSIIIIDICLDICNQLKNTINCLLEVGSQHRW